MIFKFSYCHFFVIDASIKASSPKFTVIPSALTPLWFWVPANYKKQWTVRRGNVDENVALIAMISSEVWTFKIDFYQFWENSAKSVFIPLKILFSTGNSRWKELPCLDRFERRSRWPKGWPKEHWLDTLDGNLKPRKCIQMRPLTEQNGIVDSAAEHEKGWRKRRRNLDILEVLYIYNHRQVVFKTFFALPGEGHYEMVAIRNLREQK